MAIDIHDNSTATDEQKTASASALFRKINLNVDIATQAELISVYNDLTAQIESTTDSLSNYVVEVSTDTTTEGYLKSYKIKQGGMDVATIDIPKDLVVNGGSVVEKDGVKYLRLLIANQDEPVDIPVADLVDVYTGTDLTDAKLEIGSDNSISVTIKDTIARVGIEASALSTDKTIEGVKKYVDATVTGKNVSAEGDELVDATAANNKVTVSATDRLTAVVDKVEQTSATWDEYATKKADLSALTTETTRATEAETALGERIDGLSGTYKTIADSDAADTAIKAAITSATNDARFATDAADDYVDIDTIIADILKIRKALGALKAING